MPAVYFVCILDVSDTEDEAWINVSLWIILTSSVQVWDHVICVDYGGNGLSTELCRMPYVTICIFNSWLFTVIVI